MMLNVLKEFSLSQVIALYMECRLDKRLCKYTIYIKTNISKIRFIKFNYDYYNEFNLKLSTLPYWQI